MSKDPLRSHEMYFNRELSWLEFNDRVLRQGLAEDVPLMERIKFLAIVSSNLDEFFLVRVAGPDERACGRRPPPRPGRHDARGATEGRQPSASIAWSVTSARPLPPRWRNCAREGLAIVAGRPMETMRSGISCRPTSARKFCPCSRRWRYKTSAAAAACLGCNGTGRAAEEGCWRGEDRRHAGAAADFPLGAAVRRRSRTGAAGRGHGGQRRARSFPARRSWPRRCSASPATPTFSVERDETDDMLEAVERAVLTRQRRPPVRLQVTPGADPRIREPGWTRR